MCLFVCMGSGEGRVLEFCVSLCVCLYVKIDVMFFFLHLLLLVPALLVRNAKEKLKLQNT